MKSRLRAGQPTARDLENKLKLKKLNYELIPPTSAAEYDILDRVRLEWHSSLNEARIALAWRKEWQVSKDGQIILGECHKVTDLQKEIAEFDFIVLLNQEVWQAPEFTDAQKVALLDHELSHAAIATDGNGEPQYDERHRPVFRTRKHDIEEFHGVVARHGCYKGDLERFAEALLERRGVPLLAELSEPVPVEVAAPAPEPLKLTVVPEAPPEPLEAFTIQVSLKRRHVAFVIGTKESEGGYVARYRLAITLTKDIDGPADVVRFSSEREAIDFSAKVLYRLVGNTIREFPIPQDLLMQLGEVLDKLAPHILDLPGFLAAEGDHA